VGEKYLFKRLLLELCLLIALFLFLFDTYLSSTIHFM
jgi:hypothetical protein